MHIIYKINNLTNNRYYIGSKKDWKGPNTYWGTSKNKEFWNDFKIHDFNFEILEEVKEPSKLKQTEIIYLNKFNVLKDPLAYNLHIPSVGFGTEIHSKRPGVGGVKKGTIPWNKGKTNIFSEEQIIKWKRERKGKIHSFKLSIKRLDEIKNLYENYEYVERKSKNGRLLPKARAFSHDFCNEFGLTSAGLYRYIKNNGIC